MSIITNVKAFTVSVVICIVCSFPAEETGSGLDDMANIMNASTVDHPINLPVQVMKKLLDISSKSKGLFLLWNYAKFLTRESLLKVEVRIQYSYAHARECIILLYQPHAVYTTEVQDVQKGNNSSCIRTN